MVDFVPPAYGRLWSTAVNYFSFVGCIQGRKGLVLFRNPLGVVSLLAERWKREREVGNRLNSSFELALHWDGKDCPVIPRSI